MEKKKILTAVAVAGVILAGGGVVSSNQPSVSEMKAMAKEDRYIEFVLDEDNEIVNTFNTSELIDKGREVCQILDDQFTINQAVEYLAVSRKEEPEVVAHYAERIIVGAVAYFCNRHANLLQ